MSVTDRTSRPLVSVVTPCLNMAQFIEQTINSVLGQDYPSVEYIVMDGGSTDGTLDILSRYNGRLRWETRVDRGTADAVNRGFELSRGDIFAFLNADDVYLPGAISAAVDAFGKHLEAAAVYGGAWWVDVDGKPIAPYPVRDFDPSLLERECFIPQPASFIRRATFESTGGLDPDLQLTFDYEFWMRVGRLGGMVRIDETLARSRMSPGNKTLGSRKKVFEETFEILLRHYGYVPFSWIYSYLCYLGDGRDQFFEPLKPSILRYATSLPAGLYYNWRSPWRFLKEWRSGMSWRGLSRRIARSAAQS